jgi:hypothetical protein
MVEILCIHVCKWKSETERIPRFGERDKTE